MATKIKKQLYGVIPYKIEDDKLLVMMVTSQTRKRWIFPNGNIEKGETGAQAGAREAFEEAGVKGKLDKKHVIDAIIGKSSPDGIEPIAIRFFPLEVLKEQNKWAEMQERQRQWFPMDFAINIIKDEDIQIVLKKFKEVKQTNTLDAA